MSRSLENWGVPQLYAWRAGPSNQNVTSYLEFPRANTQGGLTRASSPSSPTYLLTSTSAHYKEKELWRMIERQILGVNTLYVHSIWAAWAWAKEACLAACASFKDHNGGIDPGLPNTTVASWALHYWVPHESPSLVSFHCLPGSLCPSDSGLPVFPQIFPNTFYLGHFAFAGPLPGSFSFCICAACSLPSFKAWLQHHFLNNADPC